MKLKLILQWITLAFQMALTLQIIGTTLPFLMISTNTGEVLNNTLAVLILDQIDNMGSVVFFNWLRTNYNILTTAQHNFMQVKSNRVFESILIWVYLAVIIQHSY